MSLQEKIMNYAFRKHVTILLILLRGYDSQRTSESPILCSRVSKSSLNKFLHDAKIVIFMPFPRVIFTKKFYFGKKFHCLGFFSEFYAKKITALYFERDDWFGFVVHSL